MLICRTTLNPDAPATITGDRRRDDGSFEFYVERLDGKPWRTEWEHSHGGWCCYPLYTAAVSRNEITEVRQITGLQDADEASSLPVGGSLVVGVHASS